ncbi:MAG: hypothetical protein F6K41_05935 [Symploca sp. SIO3E6]|nr:hypothetical protein [Caldora sp. SIO3E6]
MNKQKEPNLEYQVGGTLAADDPTYIERQADKDLFEALNNQEFCYILNSRQMGKSSLRTRTIKRLKAQGVACVDINANAIIQSQGMTPEKWYLGVIDEIAGQLQLNCSYMQWWEQYEKLSEVMRFKKFLSDILLEEINNLGIVIFIDEINAFLGFSLSEFFAVIRECFNDRSSNQRFKKLTFVLIGVAAPTDLIKDPNDTPFNIGKAIELTGFKFAEAKQLSQGLIDKLDNPDRVLQIILDWTQGQPFLTQKICKMVQYAEVPQADDNLEEWIETLIRQNVINNWESKDHPAHLRTIERRILRHYHIESLLNLYQQILESGAIEFDNSYLQMELRLSGLVVHRQGKLLIYNKIYQEIFNQEWFNSNLNKVIKRPYQIQIDAWMSSDYRDQSKLLFGKELKKAQIWAQDISLTKEDYSFLQESTKFEQEIRALLPATESLESVINTVMSFTKGDEKLNKSIFLLLCQGKKSYGRSIEKWVQTVVHSRMIKNWQTEIQAEPLREICRSLLENSLCDPFWLLIAYRKVLLEEELDSHKEQAELTKIGIIIEQEQKLTIANPIYADVFNKTWTNQNLGKLRPYAKKLVAWIDSQGQDRHQLLSAKQLEAAKEFSKGKKLDKREYRFLADSQLHKVKRG